MTNTNTRKIRIGALQPCRDSGDNCRGIITTEKKGPDAEMKGKYQSSSWCECATGLGEREALLRAYLVPNFFRDSPSHRIFEYMHEALNIDKKQN
jgi:hypothetical protein